MLCANMFKYVKTIGGKALATTITPPGVLHMLFIELIYLYLK